MTGAKRGGRRGAAGAGRRGRFPLLAVARAGVGARLLHEQRGEKRGEEEEQGGVCWQAGPGCRWHRRREKGRAGGRAGLCSRVSERCLDLNHDHASLFRQKSL